jgi:hypothetical protein
MTLHDGVGDAPHLDERAGGIDDAAPDHRVDLDGDVVPGDRLLLLDRVGRGAQVDPGLGLDEGDEPEQARPGRAVETPEPENDAALVLLGDAQAGEEQEDGEPNRAHGPGMIDPEEEHEGHGGPGRRLEAPPDGRARPRYGHGWARR